MLINDRYTIDAQSDFIDSGGFGRVYKAFDTKTNTTVALKQFLVNNTNERASLKAELLRAKALTHPNIVKYLDYFETIGNDTIGRQITEQWAVMEYIEGGNLSRFIEKETSEAKIQNAEQIFTGILKGLKYLHTSRYDPIKDDYVILIHRDLKPANILLEYQGDKIVPKICDFGLSKEVLESHSGGETTSTAANSTIEYAAPELFNPKLRKDGVIQTNYDYWALGIIIYRYFKNSFPFGSREQGNTQEQIMTAILDHPADIKNIPDEWRNLIAICLVKDANIRNIGSWSENNQKIKNKAIKFVLPEKQKSEVYNKNEMISEKNNKNTSGKMNIFTFKSIFFLLSAFIIGIFLLTLTKNRKSVSMGRFYDSLYKKYYSVSEFKNNYAIVGKNGKYGFIDKKGQLLWEGLKWNQIDYFEEGLAKVGINKKYGHIDTNGQLIGDGLYWDQVGSFYKDIARVKKGRKVGFVNKKGELLGDVLIWDGAGEFTDGFAVVLKDDKYGFINTQGELMWGGLEWEGASAGFQDGFAMVQKNGKCGIINTQGELMWGGLEWDEYSLSQFHDGFAPVKKKRIGRYGSDYGYINTNGELMWGGIEWGYAKEFHEGFALVIRYPKYGFINTQGQQMWGGLEWDEADEFNEGIARVKRKNKYGYINKNGELLWGGLEWDELGFFTDGIARVKRNNKYGYINKNGEPMWGGLKWDEADYSFTFGIAHVKKDKKLYKLKIQSEKKDL